jgi:hypothetical protein
VSSPTSTSPCHVIVHDDAHVYVYVHVKNPRPRTQRTRQPIERLEINE